MTNLQRFDLLVNQYLKDDNTNELQITNFRRFLSEYELEERVFNFYESHIDDFFTYTLREIMGSESQVTSHITALKSLFSFLIGKTLKFSELN